MTTLAPSAAHQLDIELITGLTTELDHYRQAVAAVRTRCNALIRLAGIAARPAEVVLAFDVLRDLEHLPFVAPPHPVDPLVIWGDRLDA